MAELKKNVKTLYVDGSITVCVRKAKPAVMQGDKEIVPAKRAVYYRFVRPAIVSGVNSMTLAIAEKRVEDVLSELNALHGEGGFGKEEIQKIFDDAANNPRDPLLTKEEFLSKYGGAQASALDEKVTTLSKELEAEREARRKVEAELAKHNPSSAKGR
jgi:hypothetical protein